jgi:ferritin-like protein
MRDFILQFFAYEHLHKDLQEVSKPFSELAELMYKYLPSNSERATCLRKLLEAKDCAVRAHLGGHQSRG